MPIAKRIQTDARRTKPSPLMQEITKELQQGRNLTESFRQLQALQGTPDFDFFGRPALQGPPRPPDLEITEEDRLEALGMLLGFGGGGIIKSVGKNLGSRFTAETGLKASEKDLLKLGKLFQQSQTSVKKLTGEIVSEKGFSSSQLKSAITRSELRQMRLKREMFPELDFGSDQAVSVTRFFFENFSP